MGEGGKGKQRDCQEAWEEECKQPDASSGSPEYHSFNLEFDVLNGVKHKPIQTPWKFL